MMTERALIEGGFVFKPRRIATSWVAHAAPAVREIWDWLCMNASHKEHKYNGHVLKRGQLFCRYRDIREALSWEVGYRREHYSVAQVKSAMKRLMEKGMITLTKAPRGNLITICNYDTYQNPRNYEATSEVAKKLPSKHQKATSDHLSIDKNVRIEERELGGADLGSVSEESSAVFVSVQLANGEGLFDILEPEVTRWEKTYPAVDVRQKLREIAEWNRANPAKRKTRRGIPKHIANWLSREQSAAKDRLGDGKLNGAYDPRSLFDRFR